MKDVQKGDEVSGCHGEMRSRAKNGNSFRPAAGHAHVRLTQSRATLNEIKETNLI